MAHPKYVYKMVALTADVHAALTRVRDHLRLTLGFKPSLSETIAFLCEHYTRTVLDAVPPS